MKKISKANLKIMDKLAASINGGPKLTEKETQKAMKILLEKLWSEFNKTKTKE